MSGSSVSPSAARRLLVVIQVMLIVATLFAPIPAVAVEPDPTPSPSAEPTPTPTPTPEPDLSPTPDPSPEPTPTPDPTPEPTPEPSVEPSPEPTPTPEPSPTPTPEAATEPFIVTFASGVTGATQDDILAVAGAVQTDSIPQLRMRAILLAPSAVTDSLAILRDDARVLRVDTDRIRIAEETPSDPVLRRPVGAAADRLGCRARHLRRRGKRGRRHPRHRCRCLASGSRWLDRRRARRSSTARRGRPTRTATAPPWPASSPPRRTTPRASPASATPA